MTDLHIHTNNSDGSDSVSQILEKAQAMGINLISITDHNKVSAYRELKDKKIRSGFSGEIISGTELTTTLDGETIEILGYGVNTDAISKFIKASYMPRSQYQKIMFDKTYNHYKDLGLKMSIKPENFNPETMYARTVIYKDIVKFPENEKFCKYHESFYKYVSFLRKEYNFPESPLFLNIDGLLPTPNDVIAAVHNAGGLAFVAHLFIYTENIYKQINRIAAEYKPDGFECYYSKFTEQQTKYLENFCKKNKLYMSGGSDYHGKNRAGIELGKGTGNLNVNEDEVHKWASEFI